MTHLLLVAAERYGLTLGSICAFRPLTTPPGPRCGCPYPDSEPAPWSGPGARGAARRWAVRGAERVLRSRPAGPCPRLPGPPSVDAGPPRQQPRSRALRCRPTAAQPSCPAAPTRSRSAAARPRAGTYTRRARAAVPSKMTVRGSGHRFSCQARPLAPPDTRAAEAPRHAPPPSAPAPASRTPAPPAPARCRRPLRDSKNPEGPNLTVSGEAWAAFRLSRYRSASTT